MAGHEVGVEVGVEHADDGQPVLRGVIEVLGDVATGVDHHGEAAGLVADQVGSLRKTVEVVLGEDQGSPPGRVVRCSVRTVTDTPQGIFRYPGGYARPDDSDDRHQLPSPPPMTTTPSWWTAASPTSTSRGTCPVPCWSRCRGCRPIWRTCRATVEIFVICQSGNRSRSVSDFFNANGMQTVSVNGGTSAWAGLGRPLVAGLEPR